MPTNSTDIVERALEKSRAILAGDSRVHVLYSDKRPDEDVSWLLQALCDEVERLRNRFSVLCGNCGERYLGPRDEYLHGYNICNMERCED